MSIRLRTKLWLRDRGIEVVVPRRSGLLAARHTRIERFQLPADVAETFDESTGTMIVPIDRMVSRVGFTFHRAGWHPFLAALRQRVSDPSIDYRDTVLYAFYRRFQPETVHDVLLAGTDVPRGVLASWPAVDPLIDLWSATGNQVATTRREVAYREVLPHSQYWGPTPEEYGARHLERCVEVYSSLVRNGYEPPSIASRHITGYFLTRNDDYRFVIGHGNHRVPAMSLFGLTDLKVTLRRTHLAVVAEERLSRWTTLGGGLLEPIEVATVFDQFFSSHSIARASELGLV